MSNQKSILLLDSKDKMKEAIRIAGEIKEIFETDGGRQYYVEIESKDKMKAAVRKRYINFEGSAMIAFLCGVMFSDIESERISGGWKASCGLKDISTGQLVGGYVDMICLRSESFYSGLDESHLLSGAETKAQCKAVKSGLGFVLSLADIEPTPAEEIVTAEKTEARIEREEVSTETHAADELERVGRNVAAGNGADEEIRFLTTVRLALYPEWAPTDPANPGPELSDAVLELADMLRAGPVMQGEREALTAALAMLNGSDRTEEILAANNQAEPAASPNKTATNGAKPNLDLLGGS